VLRQEDDQAVSYWFKQRRITLFYWFR